MNAVFGAIFTGDVTKRCRVVAQHAKRATLWRLFTVIQRILQINEIVYVVQTLFALTTNGRSKYAADPVSTCKISKPCESGNFFQTLIDGSVVDRRAS